MEFSILIGGEAGDGVKQAGLIVAKIFNELGYHIFVYDDYQSLVRGGHNFSIIRISDEKILTHKDHVDLIVALNQDTIEKHFWRAKGDVLFDSNKVKSEGIGIPALSKAKEMGSHLLRNTIFIGAISKYFGIDLSIVEDVIKKSFKKMQKENMDALKFGYDSLDEKHKIDKIGEPREIHSGNESIALGAVGAGMKMYIAYPMTPASSILHYLASHEDDLNVVTVQPENEIAVATMAVGAAYAGVRTMVGTSGGGFALMNETVSMCAQSETPVVFVDSQRAGPSTGIPTYQMQADLKFVVNSGHGDIVRVVVAPGDAEESYLLTANAMNLAWKYQIPTFVLIDKHISESTFSVEFPEVKKEEAKLWDGNGDYKRYEFTEDGISPLAFPGDKAIVKGTSYEHDEYGITIEDAESAKKMQEKRMKKREFLIKELKNMETVKVYGNENSDVTLLTWGSTKGACIEVAKELGLKVVQPLYVEPLPMWELGKHLRGRVIAVECNASGQLADMLDIKERILKYDGRPFTPEELKKRLEEIL
ncbi:MAG: 2-oxoacid:acceptor oxidoreductase subunit alpha [Candidatus Aenigmarchaeota archaeon]|nr:2-oxoacid:acceptor oxidoreductase subunit alpha [Candidatus Aenigmarchaeota archaeon]